MAVSLGMRISGLLVVGAVAVAAAAFTSDGGFTADGRGTIVTAGPSDGTRKLPTGPPSGSPPPVRQSPDGHFGVPAVTSTPGASRGETVSERPSPSSPSPSMSKKLLEVPAWLPPGPDSPDVDGTPDPASVYDLLHSPSECRAALRVIPETPADAEWTLLRGLATACLAVQGQGGDWEQAARDHAALADKADTCKGRAAYTVLGSLLDFHRRHPGAVVRLKPAASGTPGACGYRIAGVDTGGDGEARPGEAIGIELADTYMDHAELLSNVSVSVGGQRVPGVPVLRSESGDRLVLSVVVPVLEPGSVEVAVRYAGTEVRLPAAFSVAAPEVVPEPDMGTGTTVGPVSPLGAVVLSTGDPAEFLTGSPPTVTASRPPQGVLPLGPLPVHPAGPHTPAGLRIR
ncbi:hypothetical protein QQM39_36600 [Streptomyces sp. DT2A-34]|uniref:hypothetical protein n=1 Tax=Streptomyces sp. DT2A-34 TaxID=3051182 RepID=UPI00265C1DED|nr:hypothetical protein [Streptomyces sp. DT2A-34]MDO0916153.1 hypothetical protein [Streptomyces sp. DT2A-34]